MATEIEHKYIVTSDEFRDSCAEQHYFMQGYLTTDKRCVVRVRIVEDKAYLTIKGENRGATRPEYEIAIDVDMARSMLKDMCVTPIIEKTRYIYIYQGHRWEIDCFHGANEGLIIAEIELNSEEDNYKCPAFIGRNVTGIARYYNSNLAQRPYSMWSETERNGM